MAELDSSREEVMLKVIELSVDRHPPVQHS